MCSHIKAASERRKLSHKICSRAGDQTGFSAAACAQAVRLRVRGLQLAIAFTKTTFRGNSSLLCARLAHFFIAKHNISVKYASSPANGRYNLGYAPRASVMSAFYGFVLNINPFSPYLFHIYFYS